MRHTLYVTSDAIVSLTGPRRAVRTHEVIATSELGIAPLEAVFTRHRKLPTYIIADPLESDFRTDAVPHVGTRDRAAMLARKLAQTYRASPFRYASVTGREAEGRRDDRVVYCAITNPDVLRPVLDMAERLGVPVEGVYAAPIIASRLLRRLDAVKPHTLLTTFVPGGGMRQSYYRNDELRFSRLTRLPAEEEVPFSDYVAAETSRTWQYLEAQRTFAAGERLETCIVAREADITRIKPQMRDFDRLTHRFVALEDLHRSLKLVAPSHDSSIDSALAVTLAESPLDNHFAQDEHLRAGRDRRLAISLYAAAAGIATIGAIWSGYTAWSTYQLRGDTEQRQRDIAAIDAQVARLRGASLSTQVPSDVMRDTVQFYRNHLQTGSNPRALLLPVGESLERFPMFRLEQIAWQASDDANARVALKPTVSAAPPISAQLTESARGGEAQTASSTTDEPILSRRLFEVAALELLWVPAVAGGTNYREGIQLADALAADLSRHTGIKARVVETPIQADAALKISARGTSGTAWPPQRFVLQLTRSTRPQLSGAQ